MNISPKPDRRNVFLDIETLSLDPGNDKGALSALTGRVACVCLLMDDGATIREAGLIDQDETCLLERFWRLVRPADQFVGYNVLGFDLPFLRQRSWIQQARPSRKMDLRKFYSADYVDLMQVWTNWGGAGKFPKLDEVAEALGVGQKSGHGCEVAEWWNKGEYQKICDYCRDDVRLTYKVFYRLMFQPLPERYLDVERATAAAKGAA